MFLADRDSCHPRSVDGQKAHNVAMGTKTTSAIAIVPRVSVGTETLLRIAAGPYVTSTRLDRLK